MKMKFNISLALLLGLSISLTSCFKNDQDDIFDQSASERLEQVKKDYTNILTSNGGKWELQYFANSDNEGYDYLMTFKKDGTVQMSGYNSAIGEYNTGVSSAQYGTESSLWEVLTDNGPVLSFNSYNSVFHIFADPADIGSTTTNEAGRGYEGDYEFDLMKYSNDTIYLEGKKHGLSMIMTRVDSTVNDETFLNEVIELKNNLFSPKIPRIYLTLPEGNRYVISGGSDGVISYFPEGSDSIVTTESANCIVSHGGLAFLEPLKIEGHNIQNFVLDTDGGLLCTDDNKSKIDAGNLAGVLLHKSLSWTLNLTGGKYSTLIENLKTDISTRMKNFSYSSFRVYHSSTRKGVTGDFYAIEIGLTYKSSGKVRTTKPLYEFTPVIGADGTLSFTDVHASNVDNAATYLTTFPALQDLLDAIAGDKFKLSAISNLAPTAIKLVSDTNSEDELNFSL